MSPVQSRPPLLITEGCMKVKKLREILESLPEDMEVRVQLESVGYNVKPVVDSTVRPEPHPRFRCERTLVLFTEVQEEEY